MNTPSKSLIHLLDSAHEKWTYRQVPQTVSIAGINKGKCSGGHSTLRAEGPTAKHHLCCPPWVEARWPLTLSRGFVLLSKKRGFRTGFKQSCCARPGKLLIRPQDAGVVVNFANNLHVRILQWSEAFLTGRAQPRVYTSLPTGTGRRRSPVQDPSTAPERWERLQQQGGRCFRAFRKHRFEK